MTRKNWFGSSHAQWPRWCKFKWWFLVESRRNYQDRTKGKLVCSEAILEWWLPGEQDANEQVSIMDKKWQMITKMMLTDNGVTRIRKVHLRFLLDPKQTTDLGQDQSNLQSQKKKTSTSMTSHTMQDKLSKSRTVSTVLGRFQASVCGVTLQQTSPSDVEHSKGTAHRWIKEFFLRKAAEGASQRHQDKI